jgi:hypothetical protein
MGWTAGVRFMAGRRNVYLFDSVETGCGVHPVSNPMGSGVGLSLSEREAHHSPPSSAELKNSGAVLLLFHTSSWRSAYKHEDNFTHLPPNLEPAINTLSK